MFAKRGAEGIDFMIIFIAFLIVVAIASYVTIKVTGKFERKAEEMGVSTRQKFSVLLEIYGVEGAGHNGNIDTLIVYVRSLSGSSDILLDNLTLIFESKETYIYKYGGITENLSTISDFTSFFLYTPYSANKRNSSWELFEAGEIYALVFKINNSLSPGDPWSITILPEKGIPMKVSGTIPEFLTGNLVILR